MVSVLCYFYQLMGGKMDICVLCLRLRFFGLPSAVGRCWRRTPISKLEVWRSTPKKLSHFDQSNLLSNCEYKNILGFEQPVGPKERFPGTLSFKRRRNPVSIPFPPLIAFS